MKINLKKSNIAVYLLLLMPFVDMISGNMLNMGKRSFLAQIGQVYRSILILYLFFIIFIQNKLKKGKWLFPFTIYLFLLVVYYYVRFDSSIVINVSYCMKLLMPIYIVYGVYFLSENNEYIVDNIFAYYSWIYPFSMIIPKVLGIGYYNYTNQSGYKGLYYANNEVNVILVILFVYSFNVLLSKWNAINLLRVLLNIYALLLIGSKTSLLALVIVVMIFLLKEKSFRKISNYLWVVMMSGVIAVCVVVNFLGEQLLRTWQRILYFYQLYNSYTGENNAIVTFLLSERNLRIKPAIQEWFINDKTGIINFFFGIGKERKCPDDSIRISAYSIIEMDGFDLLFWFGGITLVIVLSFYIFVFSRAIKDKLLFSERIMFILVFFFSMIAGHVLMSANAGTAFALVVAKMYFQSSRQNGNSIHESGRCSVQ